VPALGLGLVADRVKNWKLVLLIHIIMIASLGLFVFSVPEENHIYTVDSPAPLSMGIGFIMSIISASSVGTVNSTLLGKAISSATLSRGVLLGASAFCGSCGVLMIDALGGHIYETDKRSPFFIVLTSEGLTILLIIGLALSRQLRI